MSTDVFPANRVPVTEAQAERAVVELFEAYRWQVCRMREDVHVGMPGIPDLLCVSPHGLQLWVEMKRPPSCRNRQGHIRKAQKELLTEWRNRGVPCCVVDGVSETLTELAAKYTMQWDVDDVLDCCDALMADYEWWPR